MIGTKLKTLKKQENKSLWEIKQEKFEPFNYKNNNNQINNINNNLLFLKQSSPGIELPFGRLTKREQNAILYQTKFNQARNYFNGHF